MVKIDDANNYLFQIAYGFQLLALIQAHGKIGMIGLLMYVCSIIASTFFILWAVLELDIAGGVLLWNAGIIFFNLIAILIILIRCCGRNKLSSEYKQIYQDHFQEYLTKPQFKKLMSYAGQRERNDSDEVIIEENQQFRYLYFVSYKGKKSDLSVLHEGNFIREVEEGDFLCMYECHHYLLEQKLKAEAGEKLAERADDYREQQTTTFSVRLNGGERDDSRVTFYKWKKDDLRNLNNTPEGREIFNAVYSKWLVQTIGTPAEDGQDI
ncbi:unnamed protein product [Moneuplotes crassus]|uniref:POPDC1-3 domain-containing protein n=1 Tax=Euplotes crassus TaxID=5936 RepID=A0AAD2D3M5_EUPCR|nr:unnamed protein product [Moneuplotes crassus]